MTYEPGACDTFTTSEPPTPDDDAVDDAILGRMMRLALTGGHRNGIAITSYSNNSSFLTINRLQLDPQECDTVRRLAHRP